MEIREAVARGDRWRERRRSRGFRPASSTPRRSPNLGPLGLRHPAHSRIIVIPRGNAAIHCGVEKWYLVGLITRRSRVRIPPPLPSRTPGPNRARRFAFCAILGHRGRFQTPQTGFERIRRRDISFSGKTAPQQIVAHVGVSPLPPPAQGREDGGGRDAKVAATVAVVVSPAAAVLAHRDDHGPEEGPARRAGEAGRRFLGPSDRFRGWVQNENVTNSPSLAYGALTAQPDPIHGPHLSARCPPDE